MVEGQVPNVEAGGGGVAGHHPGGRQDAAEARPAGAEHGVQGVARLGPVGQGAAQVDERVAEGGHVPVEHGHDLPPVRHDQVVQLEVVVEQHGGLRLGDRPGEPGPQLLHGGDFLVLGPVPAIHPPGHLAAGEALGPSQTLQAESPVVDPMQAGQGVHHVVGQPPAEAVVGGKGRRPGIAHHGAPAPLHDEERRAHHLRVGAQQEGPRAPAGRRGAGRRGRRAPGPCRGCPAPAGPGAGGAAPVPGRPPGRGR